MRSRLEILSYVIAGALLSIASLSAQPGRGSAAPLDVQLGRGAEGINVGRGIICDKPEQAQRFLALRSSGNQTMQALQAVNTEAANPHACGEAMVAFRIGEPLQ